MYSRRLRVLGVFCTRSRWFSSMNRDLDAMQRDGYVIGWVHRRLIDLRQGPRDRTPDSEAGPCTRRSAVRFEKSRLRK